MIHRNARGFLAAAGLLLALATIAGALGAHALRGVLDAQQLVSFDVAVKHQFFHSLGLIGVALLLDRVRDARTQRRLAVAAWLLIAGVLCFSGSIYLLLAGGPRLLGPVTPLGGLLLIGGWLWFALAALRMPAIPRND
ncbi:MAG: DUF423 domain-containing protein [Steroidobacteraceae bacterium]